MGGTRNTTPIGPKFQGHKGIKKRHACTEFEGSIFIGFGMILVWPQCDQKLLESEPIVRSGPYAIRAVRSLLVIYGIKCIKIASIVFELSFFRLNTR